MRLLDERRKIRMLYILLIGITTISVIATSYLFFLLWHEETPQFKVDMRVMLLIFVYLFTIYTQIKLRHISIASTQIVLLALVLASWMGWQWGVSTPQGILLFGLVITLAGILFPSKIAAYFLALTCITMVILFHLEYVGLHHVETSWKTLKTCPLDVLLYIASLTLIGCISLFSNREIEKGDHKQTQYIALLKKERDSLEEVVRERTRDLQQTYAEFKQIQKEKYIQINNLATLGRLTTGLIHDMVDALHFASFTLSYAKKNGVRKKDLHYTLKGLHHLASLIDSARKQIKHEEQTATFNLFEEIEKACLFLQFQFYTHKTSHYINIDKNVFIIGNQAKFHQCVTNLVSNAIEAYDDVPNKPMAEKIVRIFAKIFAKKLHIEIQDFANGISIKNKKNIFQPFFTTKKASIGTGIGLTTVKESIEQSFHGSIHFITKPQKGTRFILSIPQTHYVLRQKNNQRSTQLDSQYTDRKILRV
ncbi:MAG: GHKL domain-containing protein [Candidatus Pacebacteria bacterium]|nr:GHKL domain-containing protein [Candidatus Paceibacterota bacterium]